jgi:hypothetical protein
MLQGMVCTVKIEEREGVVSHLGLALFNTDVRWEYAFVTRFLERFLLEFFLEKPAIALEKAAAEHITLSLNGTVLASGDRARPAALLPVIASGESHVIEMKGDERCRKWFTATWKNAKLASASVSFPSRLDIVSGSDKRELDSVLIENLSRQPGCEEVTSPRIAGKIEPMIGDLYVQRATGYFESLSADAYYLPAKEGYLPVFNRSYAKQSIANLFLRPMNEAARISLDLTFKDAHDRAYHDTVTLNCLKHFFMGDHDPYVGFEKETADSIATVIVYSHKTYNLVHMITLTFPLAFLTNPSECRIGAVIHPDIPNDNISALFGKYAIKNQNKYSVILSKSGTKTHASP